jgi:hypothetical protein
MLGDHRGVAWILLGTRRFIFCLGVQDTSFFALGLLLLGLFTILFRTHRRCRWCHWRPFDIQALFFLLADGAGLLMIWLLLRFFSGC